MAETLILTRSDLEAVLDVDTTIAAVESAFRAEADDAVFPAGVLATHVPNGGFHVKAAGFRVPHPFYTAKINANFPGNPRTFGLPTIQGVVALFDATSGRLLSLMDSIMVTALRTAAASAVATQHLAAIESRTLLIIGCGIQGESHLRAIIRAHPSLQKAYVYDVASQRAVEFSTRLSHELQLNIQPVTDYRTITADCDIVVTCTTSTRPLLDVGDVGAGVVVAAVGADNEEKHEIGTALLASSHLIVDSMAQAATIGDLHHAIAAGAMQREDVAGTLADVVSGRWARPARTDRPIVFDSTGIALEDVALAVIAYERARATSRGTPIHLA